MLAPAQHVAEQGFPVTEWFNTVATEQRERFEQFAETKRLFLPNGKPPEVGSTFRNPDLARTYAEIREHGPRALYGGEIGKDLARAVNAPSMSPGATIDPMPGKMRSSDLAEYRTDIREPLRTRYRDLDIYSMPPSSSGGLAVAETLSMLDEQRLGSMDRAKALHYFLDATKLAVADSDRYVQDPNHAEVSSKELLDRDYTDQRACAIPDDKALAGPVAAGKPGVTDAGNCAAKAGVEQPSKEQSTNHFVVSDKWGNVVSYTNTIGLFGGSGITVPGRGFMLNSSMSSFDFAPSKEDGSQPNLPAPHKRPDSSMAPTIVLRDGKPLLALGSPGSETIITTVLQVLLNRFDFGNSLPESIAAPRMSQGNEAETSAEPRFRETPVAKELEQMGYRFVTEGTPDRPGGAPQIGAVNALEFRPDGTTIGAGEPSRRCGTVAGTVHPSQ